MTDIAMRIILSAVGAPGIISQVQSIGNSLSGSSGGLVNAFTLAGAAAVAGLGVAAVNAASDFQSSLAKVQAYAGMTQQQTEAMGQSILEMAPQLGESPKALADSLYFVASAGFKGAEALTVLRYSGMMAASAHIDASVSARALVSSLNALNLSASSAGNISDELNATVKNGVMTWDEYGSVVGKIAGTVSAAGGSASTMQANFADLNAALDVYTNSGITAHQASMWLSADMSLLYGKTDTLAKNAKKLGVSFDESKFQSMDFAGKLQYLNQITGGNLQELTKILNGNSEVAKSVQFLNNHYDTLNGTIKSITGSMKNGQTTQDMFNVAQQTLAFQAAKAGAALQDVFITVGTMLLPALSNLLGTVTPLISNFASWISNVDHARPILIGLGAILAVVLVPAIWSFASGVIAATWPVLLIGAAVAGLVAIFQHFYETNKGFKSFIDNLVKGFQQLWQDLQQNFLPTLQRLGTFFQANILPILQQIGGFLLSTFTPVWKQLVDLWNGQLLPLFKQAWAAIQPLLPILQMIGMVIATVVVVALGLLTGIFKGTVQAAAGLLSGLGTVIGGIVQYFTGFIQTVSGIFQFLKDLLTGNWSALGKDLQKIGQGIVNMFAGIWKTIQGIFQAAWGIISGYVSGFISGIIGFFQGLWDKLVGHSIIPDMIKGIIQWFLSLPGAIWGAVENFASGIITRFQNLWNAIISDAKSILGTLGNAIASIFKGVINSVIIDPINGIIQGLDKIHVNTPLGSVGFDIPQIPHLASGGIVTSSGLVRLGEFGAETVALPAGSAVYPHGSTPAGAGGTTVVNHITINGLIGKDKKEVVDFLDAELSRRLRRGTNIVTQSSGGRSS